MLRKIFILLYLILISRTCFPQAAFYKHLEGKIGSSLNIVLDVVAVNDKLGGYYYYYFDDQSGDTSWTHYGKSMPVSGTINSDNTFEFSEFNPEVKGSVFRGEINNGILSGTWTSADEKKQLPFEAIENYPPGTMSFRVFYLNEEMPLIEKKKSPAASLEFSLLLPAEYPVEAVADSVKSYIYNDFFNNTSPDLDPEVLIMNAKEQYFNNYRQSNEDIYQEGAESFAWGKVKKINILHNEHDILSMEFYDYGYTGGAHGLSISKFKVIDLKTGTKITLDEIFREEYYNDLRDIINAAARKMFKIERDQSLRDADFYIEYIDPSSNFYVTRDGIGFYYNQYEVAPFALGPVNIFINYKNLLRLLRPESPVYQLIMLH